MGWGNVVEKEVMPKKKQRTKIIFKSIPFFLTLLPSLPYLLNSHSILYVQPFYFSYSTMSILLSSRSIYLFDKFYYHNYPEISFYLFNPIILFIRAIFFYPDVLLHYQCNFILVFHRFQHNIFLLSV